MVHPGGVPTESTAIAVTARGLDDYRYMFALDDDMLARRPSRGHAPGRHSSSWWSVAAAGPLVTVTGAGSGVLLCAP